MYSPFNSSKASQIKLDIPTRGYAHFGTLIICLPVPHEGLVLRVGFLLGSNTNLFTGGDFLLTQNSQAKQFPTSSSTTLTWLAYTNPHVPCLTPLVSGHVLLLTYHLCLTPSMGLPLNRIPSADPSLYPLYSKISVSLLNSTFLPEGGILGFYLQESSISHTRRETSSHLPYTLKGIDLMFFAVCANLGMKVDVRPVLGDEAWDEYEEAKLCDPEEEMTENVDTETAEVTRVGSTFERIKMADIVMKSDEDPTPVGISATPLLCLPKLTRIRSSIATSHCKNIMAYSG